MPFIKLQFRPGVNRDQTDYTNEGGWYECDKIRFRSGYPEKIGGWTDAAPGNNFIGTCRQMWNWITTFNDNLLAIGTNIKVYLETGGNFYDITPLRDGNPTLTGSNTNNSVSTTNGSNVVTFALGTTHDAETGSYVEISGVTSASFTVSFTNGSANITGTSLPAVDTPVQFFTTGTLPTNFSTGTVYYVVSNVGGTTIQVATSIGGTAVVAGSAGTGTQTMIETAGTIGGIPITEINGNHKITAVNSTAFSIVTDTNATSSVASTGGTNISISFEISPGFAIATQGLGWGTGVWGGFIPATPTDPEPRAWGLGNTAGGVNIPQTDWWFDNFDNDLVMNIRNGPAFWWERGSFTDPSTALATKAISLADYATAQGFDATYVPPKVGQLLVSQQDKHLIAFGSVPFGFTTESSFDPLLVRWASQDAPGQWEVRTDGTSSSGFLRISRGSRIVRALPTRQEILVWTDTHLYTLQFTGTGDVFRSQEYADNISVASPRAMASAANITYWMGQDKFYAYTGRVETLPCTLRNHVFMNINFEQFEQIVCGTNEQWNEIWWFYPTKNSDWNDAYVVYNHLDKVWYYGTIERTAWLDTPLRPYPQAANTPEALADEDAGKIYNHEDGLDAEGAPIEAYIQSSDFDLDDGDKFMLTRRIIPDVNFDGSTAQTPEVSMEVRTRNFPGSQLTSGQDTERVIQTSVGVYTGQVFLRARARQMALKIMSENLGVQWQLGSPRLDVRPDGNR